MQTITSTVRLTPDELHTLKHAPRYGKSIAFRCGFDHDDELSVDIDGDLVTFTRKTVTAEERRQLANAETVQLDTREVGR